MALGEAAIDKTNTDASLAVGAVVAGKYKLERVIGQGGMGVVYAAFHEQLDQRVAIKFLLPHVAAQHVGAVARFVREARACAKLKSEHVTRVIDVGTFDDGSPYMVMEYLTGTDLGHLIKSYGALAIDDAVDYVLQACDALAEAHALGIVHRDLKPSNLFVARNPDGTATIKLLDFGIAKAPAGEAWSEGALTGTDGAIGSPMYMSPEHLRSTATVDHRTDIWSLGIILHEVLTARHPFEATSPGGMCVMIAADPPAPLRRHRPDAPAELEAILLRCLQKDRDKRFADVGELALALAPFGHDRTHAIVDRILRVTASGQHTRPSGPVKPIALPPISAVSSDASVTQPSGNFSVQVQSSSAPPASAEPAPPSAPRRRRWPVLLAVALGAALVLAFVLSRRPAPAPAASPPAPVASVEPPRPIETVGTPAPSSPAPTPCVTAAAAPSPVKSTVKPLVKSPSKPSAVASTANTGAPSDPTETRK